MKKRILLLMVWGLIFSIPQMVFAKCAEMEFYYCVTAVFEKELDLTGPEKSDFRGDYGKQFCAGSVAWANKSVTVVFQDKQPCPVTGERLLGHLMTLCQDTGRWTNASYRFIREQDFCTKSYDESMRQAEASKDKIQVGMTRAQVRELLNDYVFLSGGFTEQYYLHPNIVLEVTFDEPNGAYSQDNKVQVPAVIRQMSLPQP